MTDRAEAPRSPGRGTWQGHWYLVTDTATLEQFCSSQKKGPGRETEEKYYAWQIMATAEGSGTSARVRTL